MVTKRLAHCITLLDAKNKEYASDDDKLANFKEAGALKGETPEKALWGMWCKHVISIKKIIDDLDRLRLVPTTKTLDEKISDNINYLLLLEALITERRRAMPTGPTGHLSYPPFVGIVGNTEEEI